MKWAILIGRYNIEVVEAGTAEEAAKVYNENQETKKKRAARHTRTGTSPIQVIDIEAGKIREFELTPPPTPPISEWTIQEVTEEDDEDEDLDEEEDEDDGSF